MEQTTQPPNECMNYRNSMDDECMNERMRERERERENRNELINHDP